MLPGRRDGTCRPRPGSVGANPAPEKIMPQQRLHVFASVTTVQTFPSTYPWYILLSRKYAVSLPFNALPVCPRSGYPATSCHIIEGRGAASPGRGALSRTPSSRGKKPPGLLRETHSKRTGAHLTIKMRFEALVY